MLRSFSWGVLDGISVLKIVVATWKGKIQALKYCLICLQVQYLLTLVTEISSQISSCRHSKGSSRSEILFLKGLSFASEKVQRERFVFSFAQIARSEIWTARLVPLLRQIFSEIAFNVELLLRARSEPLIVCPWNSSNVFQLIRPSQALNGRWLEKFNRFGMNSSLRFFFSLKRLFYVSRMERKKNWAC